MTVDVWVVFGCGDRNAGVCVSRRGFWGVPSTMLPSSSTSFSGALSATLTASVSISVSISK